MPNLGLIEIEDYEELLAMSSNRRQRYYKYLWATKIKDVNDDVSHLLKHTKYECSLSTILEFLMFFFFFSGKKIDSTSGKRREISNKYNESTENRSH